ncbi:MAG: hypothetical protein PARBB_03110 [Parabacteroides distasonis]
MFYMYEERGYAPIPARLVGLDRELWHTLFFEVSRLGQSAYLFCTIKLFASISSCGIMNCHSLEPADTSIFTEIALS